MRQNSINGQRKWINNKFGGEIVCELNSSNGLLIFDLEWFLLDKIGKK